MPFVFLSPNLMTDCLSFPVVLTRSRSREERLGSAPVDISKLRLPGPVLPYRHAMPCEPWPWISLDSCEDDWDSEPLFPDGFVFSTESWRNYPRNLFNDWTADQVRRTMMPSNCSHSHFCSVYVVDVSDYGRCTKPTGEEVVTVTDDSACTQAFWSTLQRPLPDSVRVRALFIDNLSFNVLQMLGTAYRIHPSFFSSSINWIPSRHQEDTKHEHGDHVTLVLPFMRTIRKLNAEPSGVSSVEGASLQLEVQDIDTEAPLDLTNEIVFHDLLAIHMVRSRTYNTIISYHPISDLEMTSGEHLRSFVQRTLGNTLRSKISTEPKDPTYYFLAILWYVLCAWGDVVEVLHRFVKELESGMESRSIDLLHKCHEVQAHLMCYQQLLHEFYKSVSFVGWTPNPVMEAKEESAELMAHEVDKLLDEIRHLDSQTREVALRLQAVNIGALATAIFNDSNTMRRLTVESKSRVACMKQVVHLATIFLPGIFVAKFFGMNVAEIAELSSRKTLVYFAAATVALTVVTAWLVFAVRKESSSWPSGSPLWRRLAWPIFYIAACLSKNSMSEVIVSSRS